MIDREKVIDALDVALVQMNGCGMYTAKDVEELEKAAWDALKLLERDETQLKCKDEIILIQFDCGDLSCDDFAENTIFHFFFFSCFWGIFTFLTVVFLVIFG